MMTIRNALMLAAVAALAGCSGGAGLVSRNAQADAALLTAYEGESHAPVPLNPSYRVVDVKVEVPATLTTSEENGIKPRVDILWQEDPLGDRHAQVDEIMTAALEAGVAGLGGERAVVLEATMTRFHALTKRTRYSYGGDHEIWMYIAIRDAKTGELLEPARLVGFDEAISPDEALANEARGMNQRTEITDLVKDMIRYELTRPRDFQQG